MQFFLFLLLLASLSSTLALPTSNPINCTYTITRPVSFHSRSSDEVVYARLSESQLQDAHSNGKASYLSTRNPDGTNVDPKDPSVAFDFFACSSNWTGYQTIRSKYNTYFGHVAPVTKSHKKPKHCLTLRSDILGNPSMVMDSQCSLEDDESQTRSYFAFTDGPSPNLDFVGHKNNESSVQPNVIEGGGDQTREFYWVLNRDTGRLHVHSGAPAEGEHVYDLYF